MKKLIIFMMLLICAVSLNAQQQISGFGKLKLGNPIGSFVDTINIKKIFTRDEYFDNLYLHPTSVPIEFVSDTITGYVETDCYLNKNVKTIYLPKFQILENLILNNVYLSFYNDSLFAISAERNQDLEDALKLKYGTPKEDVSEKYGNYGKNQFFLTTYENDDFVYCRSSIYKYFDKNYEANFITNIKLNNKIITNIVENEENIIKNRITKRIDDQKKQQLKDL
jgi:hypothetical protein